MKKVILLGDSIRMNYESTVKEILKDKFDVWSPEDNCRYTPHLLRMLFDYRPQIEGADIIHWNAGHWDLCDILPGGHFTDPAVYVQNLERIASILKTYGRRVIFATTTPVNDANPYNNNSTIALYNKLAIDALTPMGIEINDLNALVSTDIDKYICEDLIHLTDEGIALCGKRVAEVIEAG